MDDGDLLGLLHGAVGRTATLTGELRAWQHRPLSNRAFEVAAASMNGGPIGTFHFASTPDVEESEIVLRVLHGPGGRYRWDVVSTSGHPRIAYPGPQGCDGERAWHVDPGGVYIGRAHSCVLVQRLLDPSWVLTHDLDVVGEEVSSGRAVVRVRATARPFRPRSGGPPDMAAERDLLVDAERGFLHADTALVEGRPYDVMELRDLVLDVDADPALFEPEIPDGVKVFDHSHDPPHPRPWERRRRLHVQWPISRW